MNSTPVLDQIWKGRCGGLRLFVKASPQVFGRDNKFIMLPVPHLLGKFWHIQGGLVDLFYVVKAGAVTMTVTKDLLLFLSLFWGEEGYWEVNLGLLNH